MVGQVGQPAPFGGTPPQHVVVTEMQAHNPYLKRVDIEDFLVWVYRDQKADVVVGQGQGMHTIEAAMDGIGRTAVSACGVAAVARIAELGWRVDGGGFSAGALHIDAELAHEAVLRLQRPLALLLMRHARDASRPPVLTRHSMVARPVLNGRQQPRIVYAAWDKRRNYGFCEVQWSISMARMLAAAQEYQLWLGGLRLLALALRHEARLTSYEVFAPSAPQVHEVLDFTHLS